MLACDVGETVTVLSEFGRRKEGRKERGVRIGTNVIQQVCYSTVLEYNMTKTIEYMRGASV